MILSINQLSIIRHSLLVFLISEAKAEVVHSHPSSKGGISHNRPSFKVVDDLVLPSFTAFYFSICLAKVLVYLLAVSHFVRIPFDKVNIDVRETSKKVNSPNQTSLHVILIVVDMASVASFMVIRGIEASWVVVRTEACIMVAIHTFTEDNSLIVFLVAVIAYFASILKI